MRSLADALRRKGLIPSNEELMKRTDEVHATIFEEYNKRVTSEVETHQGKIQKKEETSKISTPIQDNTVVLNRNASLMALAALSASFTFTPVSGNIPLSVNFTDTSTGQINSWSWAFGDGSTSTLQNPVHSYATVGLYTITLVVSNGTSHSTATHPIIVSSQKNDISVKVTPVDTNSFEFRD